MKPTRLLIALAVSLLGCDDSDGFYIDVRCDAHTVEVIHEAVDKLNAFTGEDAAVIVGTREASEHVIDDDYSMIVCDPVKTPGYLGMWHSHGYTDDIMIFMTEMENPDWLLSTVLHELGHYYRGDRSHSDDPCSIMYYTVHGAPKTDYSSCDRTFLTERI